MPKAAAAPPPGCHRRPAAWARRQTALAATQLLGSGRICGSPTSPTSWLCPELREDLRRHRHLCCVGQSTWCEVTQEGLNNKDNKSKQNKVTLWQTVATDSDIQTLQNSDQQDSIPSQSKCDISAIIHTANAVDVADVAQQRKWEQQINFRKHHRVLCQVTYQIWQSSS